MSPEISVIIPVYNAGVLLDRCLDSVFGQSTCRSIEVVLIDDGSSDDSVTRILARPEQDRITLIRQRNSGPASARNKGIQAAKGKYLAFLDADDYWLPDFIEITASFLDSHNNSIAVSVAQRHFSTSGEHESPKDWNHLAPEEGMVLDDFYGFWGKHRHICTGSIMIRTGVAKSSGGQREDLRVCEDLEYWALLATFGKLAYIPRLLFVSDGRKVTGNIGWVAKNMPRWQAAVPLSDWEKRIAARIKPEDKPGFDKAKGNIARNLAYCILMSKRYTLAKKEIKAHGMLFPADLMTKFMRLAVKVPGLWWPMSRLLVFREHSRRL